jgi:glutamate synthase (NADPH/NADH)
LDNFFDGKGDDHRTIDDIILNVDRAFGARISYEISIRHNEAGLPEGRKIDINLKGAAGQSFCAFLAKGVTVRLEGDANDYVGKVSF